MVAPAGTSRPVDSVQNAKAQDGPTKLQAETSCARRHRTTVLWTACISVIAAIIVVCIVKGVLSKRAMHADIIGVSAALLGATISKGYRFPDNKQGIHDQRFYDSVNIQPIFEPDVATERYAAYDSDISPGVRRYNAFWGPFESSGIPPSNTPLSCPPGYQQVPSSQDELAGKQYRQFHCYASLQIALFEAYLALDAANNIESAAVIWDVPDVPFRDPGCGGQLIRNVSTYSGCVPANSTYMLAFQDFVNFLAEHFNSDVTGRFTHYVIWNEVANGDWFDASPLVDNKSGVSPADTGLWLDMYALMMRLAHDAIARHAQAPAMLYVSIDQVWERPPGPCPPFPGGFQHCHLGSLNVVRGMWQRLGVDMDWALAIHPYGNPVQEAWPASFHFVDVDRIAQFQVEQLRALGVAEPQRWPQAALAATEQGWTAVTPEEQEQAAACICAAHALVTASRAVVFVTHNDFQAVDLNDTVGLVPRWTGRMLNSTQRMDAPTFAAYAASHPGRWRVRVDHYCCQTHQLGCPISGSAPPSDAAALARIGRMFTNKTLSA